MEPPTTHQGRNHFLRIAQLKNACAGVTMAGKYKPSC